MKLPGLKTESIQGTAVESTLMTPESIADYERGVVQALLATISSVESTTIVDNDTGAIVTRWEFTPRSRDAITLRIPAEMAEAWEKES